MPEIKFSDNYNDLSQHSRVNAGFQFEFSCERCDDTWRTDFVPFRSGQASGWLGKAAGIFGGAIGGASEALEGLAQSDWGKAHDEAFKQAVEQAKRHFHRCARCFQYVCDTCLNKDKGLCLNCAPSAEVEIEAARAQGECFWCWRESCTRRRPARETLGRETGSSARLPSTWSGDQRS